MSKKQFEVIFYGDVINCVRDENGKEYNLHELIDILMDQQATIRKLQDLCGKSDGENAKLRIENKRLQELNDDKGKRIISLIRTNKTLNEENEQLRKELDNFKPVMFQDVRKGTVILYSKGDIV